MKVQYFYLVKVTTHFSSFRDLFCSALARVMAPVEVTPLPLRLQWSTITWLRYICNNKFHDSVAIAMKPPSFLTTWCTHDTVWLGLFTRPCNSNLMQHHPLYIRKYVLVKMCYPMPFHWSWGSVFATLKWLQHFCKSHFWTHKDTELWCPSTSKLGVWQKLLNKFILLLDGGRGIFTSWRRVKCSPQVQ